jgi:hypothetical protein
MSASKITTYFGLIIISFFASLLAVLLIKWWIVFLILFIFTGFILEEENSWWLAFWLGIFKDLFWADKLGGSSLLLLVFAFGIKFIFDKIRQRQTIFKK